MVIAALLGVCQELRGRPALGTRAAELVGRFALLGLVAQEGEDA